MIREILGILSDIIGVVFVWWEPVGLEWYWKVLFSAILIIVAVALLLMSRNRPIAKVKDYSWEDNKDIMLFLNKNAYYTNDMLVSVYMKEENRTTLCAIGYVKLDPEDRLLHIQVVDQVDANTMAKIRSSPKRYKHFYIKPSVTHKDILGINWK